jgi:hypothetical protein
MATGAIVLGVLGGIAGLIIGLIVYPPTAWAALFELGIPSAIVGAILGIAVDLVLLLIRRLRHMGERPTPVR